MHASAISMDKGSVRVLHLLLPLLVTSLLQVATAIVIKSSSIESQENDSRFISYQDLLATSNRFEDEDTTTYSQLLFDVSRNQMIVGARDVLYRFTLDLQLREKSVWEATPSLINMCQDKGQTVRDCRNYIMVLQTFENLLYACGTYAFNPNCSWRQMENLTAIRYDRGVGMCPFNPHSNITTLMTGNGNIFVGTTTDFSGTDSAILRADVNSPGGKIIRTNQYNSKWLSDPQFVGSFEAGSFVYFVFRETAFEYSVFEKVVYSRIARVCKNDYGGDMLLKDNWSSFQKARLNCSLPGEYPFYFNEIQGMTYSTDEDVLYATFTTPMNSIHGSAVCAFNLSTINDAFSGPFRYQQKQDSIGERVNPQFRRQYECKSNPSSSSRYKELIESSMYQLMDESISAMTGTPLYHSTLERFVHISVDITATKHSDRQHVLYVSTEANLIKKLSVLPRSQETCVIEIWQAGDTKLHTMQFLKMAESLYIGSEAQLIRIPAQHCSRHVSKTSCLNAMDPYCGWNELLEQCTPPPNGDTSLNYWIQNALQCPILTAPIDGGWSAWTEWNKCTKHSEKTGDDGSCLCRSRNCNNPSPKNGGRNCAGIVTEVTNCTVNGGWTEWSAWSACSQTCGVAVKTRRRTCGNPKPAHGGRTCVGQDRSEIYCSQLPPCPAPKPQAIDGSWGPWGQWSECSAQCGGGFRIRRRECNDPVPQNGGLECPGCSIDYEVCNAQACPEVKRLSSWTPWLVEMNESQGNGSHVEKRFRFACKAMTSDVTSMRINLSKEETRVCKADGICQRHNENDDDSGWGEWSTCSVSCGGGLQIRLRKCEQGGCDGKSHRMSRVCNTHPCSEEWSTWSEWSPCSVTCGLGVRRRARKCLAPSEHLCLGSSVEEEKCEMSDCEGDKGWSLWSEWSPCSLDGVRLRYRECLLPKPSAHECRGEKFEKLSCLPDPCQGNEVWTAGSIWGSILAIVLCTSLLSIFCTYFLLRRQYLKSQQQSPPPTPNFDAYPNQYSSLPTKDYYESRPKVKRQPSFNMSSTSKSFNTGTLAKTNNTLHNNTPKVLAKSFNSAENGTLKRKSHGLNNYRAGSNLDDEKF